MNDDKKKEIVFKFLINKMLKPHKVDYDYVCKNQKIKVRKWIFWTEWVNWFEYYTWTRADQEVFATEAIEYVRKTLRYSKQRSTQVVSMFLLSHGLKCNDYKLNK